MLFSKVIYEEDPQLEEEAKEKPYGKMKYVAVIKAEIFKSLVLGGVKAEKLKSLLHDGYKGDKLRFFMVARKRSSQLKIWALRLAYLVLLWTILVQFKGIGDMVTPTLFKTRSAISLPPESAYLLPDNVTYSVILIGGIKKNIE